MTDDTIDGLIDAENSAADNESHSMTSHSVRGEERIDVPDDESPLNGTVVSDMTSPKSGTVSELSYLGGDGVISRVSDTTPPTANHGFLEQWSTLTQESLSELQSVCEQGLTPEERLTLFRVGFRIIMLAAEGATDETFKDYPELAKELQDMALQLGV